LCLIGRIKLIEKSYLSLFKRVDENFFYTQSEIQEHFFNS